jgi:diaminohydroxyphosphoribosylaminopyrimidine deaminase/5-amino-6-(5-phosphoribosylamino)uracil reductase
MVRRIHDTHSPLIVIADERSTARDVSFMRLALRLPRGRGQTSPTPMVGAVLVKRGRIIGRGWHRRAGEPHAEVEAIRDAERDGETARGATLYVTLEPCCTHGRTPPCTDAIKAAGVRRVVVAARDPNPAHAGRGFKLLRRAGVRLTTGVLAEEATRLNESFNHWITRRTPFVTVKAAMTSMAKSPPRPANRSGSQAKLREKKRCVCAPGRCHPGGCEHSPADDPSLTVRGVNRSALEAQGSRLRRIVLDAEARIPTQSGLVSDGFRTLTTIVVAKSAPSVKLAALSRRVNVWRAPARNGRKSALVAQAPARRTSRVCWSKAVGSECLFLLGRFTQRVVFFMPQRFWAGAIPARPWPAKAREPGMKCSICAKWSGAASGRIS